MEPGGAWAGFARATVEDWLALLEEAGVADPTRTLAVLRGALLDLLATGDAERTTKAVLGVAPHIVPGHPPTGG